MMIYLKSKLVEFPMFTHKGARDWGVGVKDELYADAGSIKLMNI